MSNTPSETPLSHEEKERLREERVKKMKELNDEWDKADREERRKAMLDTIGEWADALYEMRGTLRPLFQYLMEK